MKKYFVALLISCCMLLVACSMNKVDGEKVSDSLVSIEKETESKSFASDEDTSKVNVEESSSANHLEESDELGILLKKFEIPTFETDREFYDWLLEFFVNYNEYNLPDDFWAGNTEPIYEIPWFQIDSENYYDLNGDGREDFVISGPLGLRCLHGTNVYLTREGGYDFFSTRGEIVRTKNGYIEICCVDYGLTSEGQDYYVDDEIIKIGENNEITSLILYSSVCDIDFNPKTENYYKGDEEITKEEYESLLAKYEKQME